MLVDHHLHILEKNPVPVSPLTLRRYLSAGKKRGVNIFGFLDHAYMFDSAQEMNFNSWQDHKRIFKAPQLIDPLVQLKRTIKQEQEFQDLIILTGLEVDFFSDKILEIEKFIKDFCQQYQPDFLTGSVHWVNNGQLGVDLPESRSQLESLNVDELYAQYFKQIKKTIESELFDIIGHLDLIKFFNLRPANDDYMKEIVAVLERYRPVVEVNTSGLTRPVKEIYPSLKFLKLLAQAEVPVTLSSDAHTADRVGADFDKAKKLLEEVGYQKLIYFEQRQPVAVEL